MYNNKFNKKTFVIIAIVFIILLLILTPLISKHYQQNKPDNTQYTVINNKNGSNNKNPLRQIPILPQYELDKLKEEIHSTLLLNNVNIKNPQIAIRQNSIKQTYDDKTYIYTTDFIIDLPDIKQSYHVKDTFSMLPGVVGDYQQLVTCLNSDELIYPEFNCTDRIRRERGDN